MMLQQCPPAGTVLLWWQQRVVRARAHCEFHGLVGVAPGFRVKKIIRRQRTRLCSRRRQESTSMVSVKLQRFRDYLD